MQYTFSGLWLFIGFIILIVGILLTYYYKQVADNMGGGVMDYGKYKLAGMITAGVGLVVMLNLHSFILGALVRAIFPSA